MKTMQRRQFLVALAAVPFQVAAARSAAPQPFKVSLIAGEQSEGVWQAGVLVELEPEWKTYWRMPGDTGIPPQFDWTGSTNSEAIEVGFPIPRRFNDLGGETIGYHNRVVFPLSVKSLKPGEPVHLRLNMFFAVCKDVCIPAKAEADLSLGASMINPDLAEWQQRVPRTLKITEAPVVSEARFGAYQDKPMLVLNLARAASDIFVESNTTAYFGKPRFDISLGEAWLPIGNLKDTKKLLGAPLKLTLSFDDSGIEQTVAIN
jgi:DsbC/DsbD-like thiol-disulfide interchange protein